jgi:hypothetical protein
MADLTPAQLQDPSRYRLLAEIEHANLLPFVHQYYRRKRSWVVVFNYLFTLAILAAWVITGVSQRPPFIQWPLTLLYAVLAFLPLVPVHEAIHGLTYKIVGAPHVDFHLNLRQLNAYAIAPDFVAGKSEFAWVALAPFLIINGLLLLAAAAFPAARFFLLALTLIHTTGTSGDWALLNFFWLAGKPKTYTYDDAAARKTFFYQENA